MLALPIFFDIDWYKDFINSLDDCTYLSPMEETLKIFLMHIGYPYMNISDFSVISFDEINKIYRKIKKLPSDYFYTTRKVGGRNIKIYKHNWKKFINAYNSLIRKKINVEIVKQLNIKCCPYCNENYIFNRNNYSTAQLDHFYSKNEYPVFAICLYNLVPACPVCNHVKGTKDIGVSPHNHMLNFDEFRFSYSFKSMDWINDPNEIKIEFLFDKTSEFGKNFKTNLSVLKLKDAYENHTDYVQEILKKTVIYNDDVIDNIMDSFPSLFSSKEEVIQMLFGNYINNVDLLKRPLSKLTHDILIENGII